jgi:hypothetical protein
MAGPLAIKPARKFMTEDPDFISYLLLLRFGSCNPNPSHAPILNYTSIARAVKRPVETVRRLIQLGLVSS